MRISDKSSPKRVILATGSSPFVLGSVFLLLILQLGVFGQSIALPGDFQGRGKLKGDSAIPGATVTVTAPTKFVLPGTSFDVPVTTTDLSSATTGVDVIAYDLTLTYNPAVIVPQSPAASGSGTISDNGAFTINTLTPGTITISFFRATPLVGAGTLFNFKFTAVGSAPSSTPLTWTNFKYNEGNPDDFTVNGFIAISVITAAEATLSGRVLTQNGVGLKNAVVTMTDPQGVVHRSISSSFGYYRFDDLPVGTTYILNVASKRFQFMPRVVTLNESLTDWDLIAVSGD